MTAHTYICPRCGAILQSAADVSGRAVKCLGCQSVFTARPPAPSAPAGPTEVTYSAGTAPPPRATPARRTPPAPEPEPAPPSSRSVRPQPRRRLPEPEDEDELDDRRDDRDREDEPPRTKRVSVLGILSLVQGIGGLVVSVIPIVGVLGLIGGAVGLILGVIGLVLARKSGGRVGTGFPIAGTVVSAAGMVCAGAWLAVVAALFSGSGPPGGGGTPGPQPADGQVIALPVDDLEREYDENEPAADGKYKGRQLEVTGAVQRVTGDAHPGKLTVELTGARFATVECIFPTSKRAELGRLVVGESVTIRGRCKGKVDGVVVLENCVRVESGPDPAAGKGADPAAKVTAGALGREYQENELAADGKYKGKAVEVTGKVARVARTKPGKVTVELQGDEDEFGLVFCDFLAKDSQPVAALKAGQVVTIRGKCQGNGDGVVTLDGCSLVK